MQMKLTAIVLAAAMMIVFTGCAGVMDTARERPGATVGAGVGATAGAVLGGDTKGSIVGGLIGALVGGAVGHYAYDRRQDRQETAQRYDYTPESGTQLNIEDSAAQPARVSPGDAVEIEMTYALLNPSEQAQTRVTEIREITHDGQLVGRLESEVDQVDGTYTSTVPIQLPEQAEAGTYEVKTIVRTAEGSAEDTTSFTVG
jgi:hypothetical protein